MRFKETETLELKKSTSELKEAVISVASILNKHGKGILYFGIEDNGKIVGQQIGKSTLKDITQAITDHIDPKIFPDIRLEKVDGRDCISVRFDGHENLYSAYGRFYLRIGDENKKLSTKEIERLIEKKKNYIYRWGFQVSEKLISAVNVPSVRTFIKRGREASRISYSFDTVKNVLNKLNLTKDEYLLNAGSALFCKNNGLEVRAALFATNEKTTFLDIQLFKGTLFDLVVQCETYVKEHINWRADIVDFKRQETPEIPIKAVREAIVNSLCHRDFDNPAGNEIAIYKNRIEIYNPGQFPFQYSPYDFISGKEKSIPRNPLIADAFYLTKDIEGWGSGLKRISDECKSAGIKVTFEKIKSGFLVSFYRHSIAAVPAKEKKGEGVNEGVNEGVKFLLEYIRKNPGKRAPYIAIMIKIPLKTLERWLKKLKVERKIKYKGSSKTGGYYAII